MGYIIFFYGIIFTIAFYFMHSLLNQGKGNSWSILLIGAVTSIVTGIVAELLRSMFNVN